MEFKIILTCLVGKGRKEISSSYFQVSHSYFPLRIYTIIEKEFINRTLEYAYINKNSNKRLHEHCSKNGGILGFVVFLPVLKKKLFS